MEIHSLEENEHNRSGLKITAIKPAVKNENRVNIFVNEEYAFSLDLAQVVDYKIKVGKNLSSEELDELKHASEFGKLYQRTLEWVLTRPHSEKETRDYLRHKRQKRETENRQAIRNRERTKEEREKYKLRTKELPLFSDDDIEKIITRLIEKGYLNDYEFAKYFLENRNAKKGTSIKKLKLELIKKGISQTVIDELLNENLRTDEEEIQKIIKKKRKKYDDEKLIQYLVRQGFDFQLARAAVSETD
ncbi:RecX family transcriptional regulator [Candidatus Saccharibacteria bacterium]|nr:RecX family transcriptional regulator [Candidatus Saccharibacteria bacterium]